jgi:cobalt/nickel transport system ATP-binding protein
MLFELRDVAFQYEDGTPALSGIDTSIAVGDRLVILGANGSGKSTLLRILAGLEFPTAGGIRWNGTELSEKSLRDASFRTDFRTRVGFVFQNADAQLFNATVQEEIEFGPRQMGLREPEVRERATDIMRLLGIQHLADRPPFRLSGGEKRKVAMSSVLSMNPDVILMDEPFLGLDPRSQSWLLKTLQILSASGKTTILATHTLDLVPQVSDRVWVLDETHHLIADAPSADVLRDLDRLQRANLTALEGASV